MNLIHLRSTWNHLKKNKTDPDHSDKTENGDIDDLSFMLPLDIERHLIGPWGIRIGKPKLDHGDENEKIATRRSESIHIPERVHGAGGEKSKDRFKHSDEGEEYNGADRRSIFRMNFIKPRSDQMELAHRIGQTGRPHDAGIRGDQQDRRP